MPPRPYSTKLLSLFAGMLLLTACSRNHITLHNQGTNTWQQVKLKAGGESFRVAELAGSASEHFSFRSSAEDGGNVSAVLNGTTNQQAIGYFSPNLSSDHAITFSDDGTITVITIP